MDDLTYYNTSGDLFAALAGVILIIGFIGLIGYVFSSIALMMLFKKAGHPQAWGAWVPFYNTYLFIKFGGQNTLWFWIYLASIFVAAVPFIGSIASFVGSVLFTIATVYAIIFISKSFGKQDNIVLWTLFGFFLLPVWALVLALGSDEYYRTDGPLFLNKDGYAPEPW